MLALIIVLVFLAGFACGYVHSLLRTDRTIAAMTPEEIEALDQRIRARRALRGG